MDTRLGQRGMAIIFGVAAALGLIVLIVIGSRGFHVRRLADRLRRRLRLRLRRSTTLHLLGARPPTWRYFKAGWQLFLSLRNFRRYTPLIPAPGGRPLRADLHPQARPLRWVMHSASSGASSSPA